MQLIQYVIILFALFAVGRVFVQYRRGNVSVKWLIFWILFWVLTGLVVWLPQTTEIVARFVGVGRGVDVAIYISIPVLFYLVFRLFVRMEDIDRDMTTLVRKIALTEIPEKKDHET
ncbi:MAG: hypothetical protein UU08_C0011G0014 [Candidatus Uhrbacteria bacterium GW2011_GWE2_40_58]|nr:MAG: hypothetical protein UT94_C0010G0004 [Candidatus Uhrbacteria bacterium GW2011_GWF2_40_263]KKR67685.1 MAG: hypothetical protein UU08_C0011G0014 [Candidatus Uhrbacteria bacterium GW2011_GWE2_40_58]OGL94114.1 MAG: hypothetical protein A2239_02635 [Candidatus Uhrbacteria bacterium RIFOXYA2_FULL_40_9]OGL96576.1 MAG: hypothetical protein A2332_00070 [Candidatus Uhrbacteria bacterium RIFOXYB2_FULL_41_18]HBK35325.1 DUF2304 domain-containing protein [Candidatus Uhrbacteria bacterium]